VAILRERNEVRDLRAIRKQAQHLDRFLTTFARSTGWLSPGDEAEAAADMAAGFKNRDAAIRLLVPTLECINELRLLAAELNRLGIAPPPPSHSDPLARYFVEAMATAYKAICGRKPPRSRKGPFVDLLATAWLDLGFPWPPPNTSLDVWLGQKVEAYRL
jgi:hypothetical protein